MAIETSYLSASGSSDIDCVFIGHRFDTDIGFRPGEIESWILTTEDDGSDAPPCHVQYGAARWYTGVWRSPAKVTYVVDGDGEVHVNSNLWATDSHLKWTRHPLQASLFGVFGLDDQNVWVWGQRRVTTGVMFRWDGVSWNEVPAPTFEVVQVHGTTPNLLFAVGRNGGIAQWDGSVWRQWSCPVPDSLTSVYVVSEDEIYATGDAGALLEGSRHGWAKIASGPGPGTSLFGVAKWKDHLWVAGGPFGLLRRVGVTDKLEVVKDKVHAIGFDARVGLLATVPNRVVGSTDGNAFSSMGTDILLEQRAGKRLLDIT